MNLNNGKLCPEVKSDFFYCLMIIFFTVLGEPSLAFEQNNTLVSLSRDSFRTIGGGEERYRSGVREMPAKGTKRHGVGVG